MIPWLRNWALAASSMRSRVLAVSAFDLRMVGFSGLETFWLDYCNF